MSTILLLIGIALVLYFFEVFVPGGVLAILGMLFMAGAVYVGYAEYGFSGASLTFLVCFALSVVMILIELWMIKRFGKRRGLLLVNSQKDYREDYNRADESVVGQTGEALTTMAPSGTVKVGDRKYEAFSQDGYLSRGTPIQVVKKQNFRLVVREVKAEG